MAQLNANPLLSLGTNPSQSQLSSLASTLTPGLLAAYSSTPSNTNTLGGAIAGLGGKIGGTIAANAGLNALGMGALTTGSGLLSSIGLGAGLGSIVPGLGTMLGALVGAFLPDLFKKNAPAINDIEGALSQGKTVTPAQWNQAGYGSGGSYLSAEQLLSPASGQKNNAPLRDIADALYDGDPISNASWAQAGLPAGGGAYGQYLEQAMSAIKGDAGQLGLPSAINSKGLSAQQLAGISSLLPQYG